MNEWNAEPETPRRPTLLWILIAFFVLLFLGRSIASTLLEFEWWKEIGQLSTWFSMLLYGTLPVVAATLLCFGAFAAAYWLGARDSSRRAGASKRHWIALAGCLLLAAFVANSTVESWTTVRFLGARRMTAQPQNYIDPIFQHPLSFYFFDLPFYHLLLHLVLTTTIVALLLFWFSAHYQQLRRSIVPTQSGFSFERSSFYFSTEFFESSFLRIVLAIALAAFAIQAYLNRFDLLWEDHGAFLYGVDYVAEHIVLPLQWLLIGGALLAAVLVLLNKARLALLLLLLLPVRYLLPPLIESTYVRPNELALQKPYIQHHIEGTRSAFGLSRNLKETALAAKSQIQIDFAKHRALLENVRLWDWRAFHDTISQIQPLRPYAYSDTDVDRYMVNGSLRQVLLTARELDIQQLGEARNRWVNPHLIYTHGYGLVLAGANEITADGLPNLLVKDAPPQITVPDFRIDKPDIYYGERTHEPVYVGTKQPEFSYPSSGEAVHTTYHGSGGFPISSLLTRVAAAVKYTDVNLLLTSYLQPSSRMMIHRQILDRLSTAAGFILWDGDPYMVISKGGRLVWTVDGYLTSSSHPYSRVLDLDSAGSVNYMRNSVKATVDAYTGEIHLYVFDETDPLVEAYRQLFPNLFEPKSRMPEDIRAHVRYPELLFSVQAEIYRAFHMRDPEAFYNRADLWDLARTNVGQGEPSATVKPTYVMATLPGETQQEFLLIMPFTPSNKDNLIGLMAARSDGSHLGEVIFEQLGKQNIIYGPKQIEAFISQDQTISKDLTLWNQQHSEVLRGQVTVLPIEDSFLYVQPIYIQSSGARMPQMKKVALAMGDKLAYADNYQQALQLLIDQNESGATAPAPEGTVSTVKGSAAAAPQSSPDTATRDAILRQVRDHLGRYRALNAQGKYAEAGKELEQIQKLLGQ